MTILVAGASGATGKLLVEQLLESGQSVKVIVRSTSRIPDNWKNNGKLEIIEGNMTEIPVEKLSEYLADCQAVACCLGHNMTLKGIYGKPRKLVRDSVSLLCKTIEKNAPEKRVKFVLMNTAGNRNRGLNERISVGERMVTVLLRLLLPPHPDNEKAADYLRTEVGQNHPFVAWAAVRPDTLIDEDRVTEYSLHQSPERSALFNPGKTSRINVANVIARLITDENLWTDWKGKMPVIYNRTEPKN